MRSNNATIAMPAVLHISTQFDTFYKPAPPNPNHPAPHLEAPTNLLLDAPTRSAPRPRKTNPPSPSSRTSHEAPPLRPLSPAPPLPPCSAPPRPSPPPQTPPQPAIR